MLVLMGVRNCPKREFLHVDDLANAAVVFSLQSSLNDSLYNIGSSIEVSIKELAEIISEIVGYFGDIKWDQTKPDGTPRKLLDSSKIRNLGWIPKYDLVNGINQTYLDYKKSLK